ncbi:helix-turn-helix transcriptional regulator [Dyadobacter sp. Leaf189]|uniref:helix-turn-helix transcriptional regulator n=1 Tax=Dyadobacter sp. Leaf189 TaxID=1736295 RepID=UPI00070010F0|nr:helix-turn-helix transcriptional regulator [Dyadobacter sp. Leaf189]KQS28243.1 XRE family transcriptional regulator [Dyadobacter sp. Leaf189]
MTLSDKIKKILADKALSPSIFADEIGVQRSSMSHILAGRNKPSLEMVQKIVKRYPDLGLEWILDENELPQSAPEQPAPRIKKETAVSAQPQERMVEEPKTIAALSEKRVDRIIIFYTDGTFKEFQEK